MHHCIEGDDYAAVNETVTFQVDDLELTMSVLILDNVAVEDVEQYSFSITPIPGLFPVAVKNSTVNISITDNDSECRTVLLLHQCLAFKRVYYHAMHNNYSPVTTLPRYTCSLITQMLHTTYFLCC